MLPKPLHKSFISLAIILSAIAGCSTFASTPIPTVTLINTATEFPTKTPVPSATLTLTPEPSLTPTVLPAISLPTKIISSQNIRQLQQLGIRELAGKPDDFFSRSMDFALDGRLITATNNSTIYVWDAFTGQPISTFDQSIYLWKVAISSNGKMVSSFDDKGVLKLWDVQTGKEIYTLAHDNIWNTIWSLAFSPDNMMLASGNFDGKVIFWDIQTGKELNNLLDPNGAVNSIAFSPDSKIFAIGTDYRITLWDLNSKRLMRNLVFDLSGGEGANIQRLLFSPDGKMLAAADSDNIAMVWDISSGKRISTIVGKGTFIRMSEGALDFTSDSKMLVVGNDNGDIIFWDVFADKELRTIGSEKCMPLNSNFGFDGRILEIGCINGAIQLWGIP